jgi:hypothetical protein
MLETIFIKYILIIKGQFSKLKLKNDLNNLFTWVENRRNIKKWYYKIIRSLWKLILRKIKKIF